MFRGFGLRFGLRQAVQGRNFSNGEVSRSYFCVNARFRGFRSAFTHTCAHRAYACSFVFLDCLFVCMYISCEPSVDVAGSG